MDPFKILGIDAKASDAEVKRAYRLMATKYHPDAGGDAWVFQQIRDAYETIIAMRQSPTQHAKTSRGVAPTPTASAPKSKSSPTTPQRDPVETKRSNSIVDQGKLIFWHLFQRPLPFQSETSFFILVNVLDIVMTNILLRFNAIEANPFAQYFLIRWGFWGMIAFKMVTVALVCVLAQIIAVRSIARARFVLIAGIVLVSLVVVYSFALFVLHYV